MAYGFQVRVGGSTILTPRTAGFRLVRTLRVPIYPYDVVDTYSVPEFDDTQGMFTWRPAPPDPDYFGIYGGPIAVRPFDHLHFNNTTKVLSVTHIPDAPPRPVGFYGTEFDILFLHYK